MRKLIYKAVVLAITATTAVTGYISISTAADGIVEAKFASDGKVLAPTNWREWVFIGTPLTPNALNGGEAPFPEFHNVYIEPTAFAHWVKTGTFANGTQIAKELVLIRKNDNDEENGSTQEVSGVGYFQGEFQGLEVTVKDTVRFPDEPGG